MSFFIILSRGFGGSEYGADVFFLPGGRSGELIHRALGEGGRRNLGRQRHYPLGWWLYLRQRAVAGGIYPAAGSVGCGYFLRGLVTADVGELEAGFCPVVLGL